MVIVTRFYAGYFIILAATVLLSCQRAPETAAGNGAAPSQAQNAQQSETEIPANTAVWVQLQKDLDSSKLKDGDHFSGEVAEDIVLGGKPVIPKGAIAKGRVTNSQTAQGQGSSGLLSVVLDSVTVKGATYGLSTNPVTLQAPPLEKDMSQQDKSAKAVAAAESAFVPKKGILQFFLSAPVRLKG